MKRLKIQTPLPLNLLLNDADAAELKKNTIRIIEQCGGACHSPHHLISSPRDETQPRWKTKKKHGKKQARLVVGSAAAAKME
jgi:hypothetical protein